MNLYAYLLEHNRYCNLIGIVAVLLIAFLFSENRKKINWKLVIRSLLLQIVFGIAVLKTSAGKKIVNVIAYYIQKMYQFADEGAGFVFGNLANDIGTPWGFIFAVKVLPVTIFFSAVIGLLFHWGIIQRVVSVMGVALQPILGTSGVETLCAASNSFLGQMEVPLLVKNYLKRMSRSELFVLMVSGMATISGAILAVYAAMGISASHMLASSVMSIPGAILFAKILIPETERQHGMNSARIEMPSKASNVFDAIATGTSDGLTIALAVGAVLISFIALLSMSNYIIGYSCYKINHVLSYFDIAFRLPDLSINQLFAYLFAPFGYLLGFVGKEALEVGQLIGTKVAVNELVAYKELVNMHASARMNDIMTYALCGFSNFSSIGMQVGGIGALAPEQRLTLTQLGLYAVLGATLSNVLTALIAALLL